MQNSHQFQALDTLFFKDGRPFSMAEESWATGIFPPYPSVFYGGLRSLYFVDHLDQLGFANKPLDPTAKLKITGLLPAIQPKGGNAQAAFPIPLDCYALKENREAPMQTFVLAEKDKQLLADYPLSHLLKTRTAEKIEEMGSRAVLPQTAFEAYLQGQSEGISFARISDFSTEEPKIGIARDPVTRTAKDGNLYRLGMRRLEGKKGSFSFLIASEGLELPQEGLSRFGAEGKAIDYGCIDFPKIPCPIDESAEYFRLYLATPAIFHEGAMPNAWLKKHGLEILAAANGRTEYIGGFDIQAGRPKPMYRAVPSGTVYYIHKKGGIGKALLDQLHQGSIYHLAPPDCTLRNSYGKEGFGLSYLATLSIDPQTSNPQ